MSRPLSLEQRRAALAASGALQDDPAQARVAKALDALAGDLAKRQPARGKSGALNWLFKAKEEPPVKGLYIWGAVGRGKTMLMDMFFEAAVEPKKQRVHFHAFMADVHERLHQWRQEAKAGRQRGEEPVAPVAADIAADARLLCFDEFSVTDIADAMILARLFSALWARGIVVVATSNVEPGRLYEGGLNRALFLPFIDLIGRHMRVEQLDAAADFRLEKLKGAPVYHVPADTRARAALDQAWTALTAGASARPLRIEMKARRVAVPAAAGGVARFAFQELCGRPLGASDYIAIAQRFHTVIIDAIPVMGFEQRNEAKRFITLIDVFYEQHVKLLASAGAEPPGLYIAADGREVFEFERCASRLIEMRSTDYLAKAHGSETKTAASSAGLVET